MTARIIGHERILELFGKIRQNGTLSHAYCLVGPEQVGKRTVAKELAAQIFGVTRDRLMNLPDFITVERGVDDKTGKTKKDISVEQIRELRQLLSQHSFLSGYSVAIIDEAEKMSASAANALLKTLEEPKGKTLLFLITRDEEELPETIRSRCQMIYFLRVPSETIANWLRLPGSGKEAEEVAELARLSAGLPGRVINWLENPAEFAAYKSELERFESLAGKPFYQKIALVEELFGDKTDHIAARDKLMSVFDIWQLLVRDFWYTAVGFQSAQLHRPASKPTWTRNLVLSVSGAIEQARRLLEMNVHPRLLVEQILLRLP